MGQQECLKFLEKNKSKWWKCKEISVKLDQSIGCSSTSLKKLYRSGFIQRKIVQGNNFFYKSK